MFDLVTMVLTLITVIQLNAKCMPSIDDSLFLRGGVGIADIFQGKNGLLSVGLNPPGEVSLALYSTEGALVVPFSNFVSPSIVKPDFAVPKAGDYVLVAEYNGRFESHVVYIR